MPGRGKQAQQPQPDLAVAADDEYIHAFTLRRKPDYDCTVIATSSATAAAPERPPALDEPTLCRAFQRTAAERGPAIALRPAAGGPEVAWDEYGARAEAIA